MQILLISTYELGRQPFGLASPAAWLEQAGFTVICLDLAVQSLSEELIASSDLIAFYVPMHTATRLAVSVVTRVKRINPHAHLCFYGLYAPVNSQLIHKLGVHSIIGGEFESELVALAQRVSQSPGRSSGGGQAEPVVSLARQQFLVPDRSKLPDLRKYAHITFADGSKRSVGYTEATRGCKHTCRHCPIVPVYGGRFRIVQREIVLEDVQQQVDVGANHITFGDPDFFNGPGHAIPLVTSFHERWPHLTYDVTIKIEHLLMHAAKLQVLRDTGCVLITSAVESVDDTILQIFDKRHTRDDFVRAVSLLREVGLPLNPTFVTFTPWTSIAGYLDLLQLLHDLDLVENVAPIQYGIRLLIPAGSKLLELSHVRDLVNPYDHEALCYPWSHSDPAVDALWRDVMAIVKGGQSKHRSRREIFEEIWDRAVAELQQPMRYSSAIGGEGRAFKQATVPHLSEPWYC